MQAIDKLAEEIHKDWDDAVEERTKADTQDGYYYAAGKVLVSKTHWYKVVEVQKQIQDLEAYIEEQTKMNIDNDVAGHVFGWVSCAKNILQRIRGEQ